MRNLTAALLILLALVSFLPACASSPDTTDNQTVGPPTVDYTDLPAGIGRGYPLVLVDSESVRSSQVTAGVAAPDFVMQFEDGRTIRLSDLRGRPVLLNFWATWCAPCRIEMPDIVQEANLDNDLVVIAANVQEEIDAIRPFAEEYGMTMPIARDADGKLRDLYQIRGMPTSFFIDRDGNIASIWAGPLVGDQLQEQLDGIR